MVPDPAGRGTFLFSQAKRIDTFSIDGATDVFDPSNNAGGK
jgi:hypothetical protein